eukprot:TRINITY_DN20334_c0_g1_i2.p1 TRINITY_DN20334_c0_g1~~TRINITY_DN20334_c0_g1_i2.p1  ORF type:complete len:232 (+),score=56.87 TRINITY_DN20334_c0_g1_i2:89-697(+)
MCIRDRSKSCLSVLVPMATVEDRPTVEAEVLEQFGCMPGLPAEWGEAGMLWGVLRGSRHCGMVVSESPEDAEPLLEAAVAKGVELIRVAGSMAEMSVEDIFDVQGPVAAAMRNAAERAPGEVWVVLTEGELEATDGLSKMEGFNTAMDHNKVLACTSSSGGDCEADAILVPLGDNTRLVFLFKACAHLSPASVSRLAIVANN